MKIISKQSIAILISVVVLVVALFFFFTMKWDPRPEKESGTSDKSPIHLDIWTFFDMNTPDRYYLDLWEQMGNLRGYDLDIRTFSTQQIKDKLRIAAAEKNLPDIFLVWGGTYPDYLFDSGACVPVQSYLKSAGADFQNAYTLPYEDGNNYIIPCLPEAYAVTYANKDLMDEMGLKMPETWEDLIGLVDKVNAYNEANGTDYAAIELGDRDSWLGELLYDMVVYRSDPAAWEDLEAGKRSFHDEVFRQTAEKIKQLVDKGAFPEDFLEIGEVEAVERFINREAVLFPHQSTIVYYLLRNMGENSLYMESFPACGSSFDPEYRSRLMEINYTQRPGLCICSYGQHTDEAAWLCVDFAKQVNEINVSRYGYINMTEKAIDIPESLPGPVRNLRRMLEQQTQRTAYPYALLPTEQADAFRTLTKRFYAGEYDVTRFIEEGEGILGG